MLTIHHLGLSQSERIVWLCEELGLDYELVLHTRNPKTKLSPPGLTSVPGNVSGTAPIIQDGQLTLAESGAIVEYIIHKYGNGRLALPPSHPNYPDYLYWFHYSNGSVQPRMSQILYLSLAGVSNDNPVKGIVDSRMQRIFAHFDERLSKVDYLAGGELTAADIMNVFSLTTMRYLVPLSLEAYPNIVKYLARIGRRDAYRRAMEKGDKGLEPLLGAEAPERSLL